MHYAELQSLCSEVHGGKCNGRRNLEIQKYLNEWSLKGTSYLYSYFIDKNIEFSPEGRATFPVVGVPSK